MGCVGLAPGPPDGLRAPRPIFAAQQLATPRVPHAGSRGSWLPRELVHQFSTAFHVLSVMLAACR